MKKRLGIGISVGLVLIVWSCKEASDETKGKGLEEKHMVFPIENHTSENSALPRLYSNGKELFLSWVTSEDSLSTLYYSKFNQTTWSQPEAIISGTDWFVNWADFPQIAENKGNILTSFLQKSASGTYTYDVKLNLYNDSTKTWKKNFLLHSDGTQSEHGFVSIKPIGNAFFVSWLDGRNTKSVDSGHQTHKTGGGAMTLRGAMVGFNGEIFNEMELDDRVCDCCNTAVVTYGTGMISVAYRDRSEEEIRDISLKTLGMHNRIGSKTIGNDQWKIEGCPVNGPAIDVYENSIALAWFTGANEEGKVNVAFSPNYQNPFRIDSGNATGRVDIVMFSETEATVLWMEPKGDEEVIQLMKINQLGEKGTTITIAKTSSERASGFPQLERVADTLYVAWTISTKSISKIEMAAVPLTDL